MDPMPPPAAGCSELLSFASKKDKALVALGCVLQFVLGIAQPLSHVAFGSALTGGLPNFTVYVRSAQYFLAIGASAFLANFASMICVETAKHRMVAEWKKSYVRAVLRQDVGWHDLNNAQELSTRMGESLVLIETGLGAASYFLWQYLSSGLAGLSIGFLYLPDVAGVILAVTPLLVISLVMLVEAQRTTATTLAHAYAAAGGVASEALTARRTVAAFGMEESAARRYDGHLRAATSAGVRRAAIVGFATATLNAATFYMIASGLAYGALRAASERERTAFNYASPAGLPVCARACNAFELSPTLRLLSGGGNGTCVAPAETPFRMTCFSAGVARFDEVPRGGNQSALALLGLHEVSELRATVSTHGCTLGCSYDTGGLVTVLFSVLMGMVQLGLLSQPLSTLSQARHAAGAILATMRHIPQLDSFSDGGAMLDVVRGAIAVERVVFAYPASPDAQICRGLTLAIAAGQTCALCGPSGAGKSTVIELLERFYDPQSGSILLDGADIRTLNVRWLRAQFGYVGQEPVLFSGTVGENIGYGKEGATHAEIEEAATTAHAHEFIVSSLTERYETQVGQGGGRLSGGQKQRVAIARALIKKPAVLLLDEATSALDQASEKVVQAALDEITARQRRTTVVIAHRLSTIRHSDVIAVVSAGAVVEQGTHEQLTALRGLYYDLLS